MLARIPESPSPPTKSLTRMCQTQGQKLRYDYDIQQKGLSKGKYMDVPPQELLKLSGISVNYAENGDSTILEEEKIITESCSGLSIESCSG